MKFFHKFFISSSCILRKIVYTYVNTKIVDARKNMDRRGKIQLQIRRYINSILVKQAGNGNPVPLREVALAERFQTTRTTVQRACRELIAEGILTRIPGRSGLFVNNESPSCRGSGTDFRILCGDGREQIFDFSAQHIVDSFCRSFPDFYSDYCYTGLLSSNPDQIIQELMEIPCYAFLWIRPEPAVFPVADKLIDSGFPVVLIANYYDSNVPVPPSNTILFDYAAAGRERAEWIHENHFRRPLIYSGSSEIVDALSRTLESYGQRLDPESIIWFPSSCQIINELPEKIRGLKPDCLVADGQIIPALGTATDNLPELKKISIYLDNYPRARQLRKQHPELNIFLPTVNWTETMALIGECAAEMMRKMLKNPDRFQNRKITDFKQ